MAAAEARAVAAGGAGAGGGSDALDQQLAADVQNLNAFSAKQLEAFVGLAVSFLTQAGGSDAHEQLAAFTAEHRVNRKAVDSCLRALLYFFAAALKESRSQAQVRQDLAKLGMDEGRAALVASVFEKNMASMSASLIGRTLSVNELVDMEWKFGVTAASDELNKVGTCFLQLRLVLDKGNGNRESVVMEMTLPQFYHFLAQMQAANRLCQ